MNDKMKYCAYVSSFSDISEEMNRCLEFINWRDTVKKDSTVFIKPNLTYPFYKPGVTTSPEFLKCLLTVLKERTDNIIVGESDGARGAFLASDAIKGHGLDKICDDIGAKWVNLSETPKQEIEETVQGKKIKVELPKLLISEIDCFISVPVIKVHSMTTVSFSIKNLWGCHPNPMRCLHHKYLSRKLSLITNHLCPKIALIDGTYSLDGHGPMYGDPIKTNLIIGANNPVVADSLATQILGIPLSKVDHILTAEREGLGTTNLNEVTINQDWKKYRMSFHPTRTPVDYLSLVLFNSEIISKLVMDSQLSSAIYRVVKPLRTKNEQEVLHDLKGYQL